MGSHDGGARPRLPMAAAGSGLDELTGASSGRVAFKPRPIG